MMPKLKRCTHQKRLQDQLGKGQRVSQIPSTGLRHPSVEEGAGKRCSECEDEYASVGQRDRLGGPESKQPSM